MLWSQDMPNLDVVTHIMVTDLYLTPWFLIPLS